MSKNKNQQQQKRFKPKYHIQTGDNVVVISGEDKGSEGRVLKILTKKGLAIVEGVNVIHKHTKPDAENPQGGIVKKEAPINIAKLMLIDPKSGEATRVGRRKEGNKIVRYAKKSGEVI